MGHAFNWILCKLRKAGRFLGEVLPFIMFAVFADRQIVAGLTTDARKG